MSELLQSAKQVLLSESDSIVRLSNNLDDAFVNACKIIKNCNGKVVVMGMGKSGHIGNKIASTFASTGTPSFFVHPAEAGHGDLGMIDDKDVVILISYSGSANEIAQLMPIFKRLQVKTIAITGNSQSVIAKECDVSLDASVEYEACPHNLTPTNSTTVALALGDALAIALLKDKGFSPDDFARSHPSGLLGRVLLTFVKDIMHSGDDLPIIRKNISLLQALVIMNDKKLGMLIIANADNKILGVFTDGDLRRVISCNAEIYALNIFDVMTKKTKFIASNKPAIAAMKIMEEFGINSLPVVDNDKVVGAINMHTLIQAKII